MLPLSDGIRARRFPVVNVLLIVANFAVFLLYELPHFNAAVYHASFYPCTVDNACRAPEPRLPAPQALRPCRGRGRTGRQAVRGCAIAPVSREVQRASSP